MIDLDELRRGSIDMHLHPGPDPSGPRRVDAIEAATQAQQAGMRAIVLKSHQYPTTALAIIVSQLVPGVTVCGSICLDYEVGGLNFHALESSAKLGAKVVWMPTFSAKNSIGVMARMSGKPAAGEGISLLGPKGQLVPEISKILSIIKEHDMVLATGHISPAETFAVVEAARAVGIWKVVVTHAMDAQFVDKPLSLEDQQRLAKVGAFIEYCGGSLLPTGARHDPAHVVEVMKTVGTEHCIMSTDLGQIMNPPPAEGMRIFMAALLRKGISAEDIELMAKVNPAKLLGLD